jgi:hypothetical protein
MWYVAVGQMTRRHLVLFSETLEKKGFEDRVEYSEGGWNDYMLHSVEPHFRFENEDDALAFVLAFGGTVSTEIPVRLT